MSVKVMSAVWESAPSRDASELLVLLALADWCNDAGVCWPSVKSIARKARQRERNVRYILCRLKSEGLIRVEKQPGRYGTNLYRLDLTQFSQPHDTTQGMQNLQSSKPQGGSPLPPSPSPGVQGMPPGLQSSVDEGGNSCCSRTVSEPSERTVKDLEAIWERAKEHLRTNVSRHTFDTWLKPAHLLEIEGKRIRFRVPTSEFDYIREKFTEPVLAALAAEGIEASFIETVVLEGPR